MLKTLTVWIALVVLRAAVKLVTLAMDSHASMPTNVVMNLVVSTQYAITMKVHLYVNVLMATLEMAIIVRISMNVQNILVMHMLTVSTLMAVTNVNVKWGSMAMVKNARKVCTSFSFSGVLCF